MSRHRDLWKDHEVFTTLLSHSEETLPEEKVNTGIVQETPALPTESKTKQEPYGPGTLGCTYELCAGIVDKNKTLKQIAQDEIHEETGTYPSYLTHLRSKMYTYSGNNSQ